MAGLAFAPEAPVEAVEVVVILPEAPGSEVLKATVSEAVVLKPEALKSGSLEVYLSEVVVPPILGPNPQRKRP